MQHTPDRSRATASSASFVGVSLAAAALLRPIACPSPDRYPLVFGLRRFERRDF
jgi:hypothetical protein